MTLEDHLGDVLRKARLGCGVHLSAAAHAAGMSEADYSTLEDCGNGSGLRDFAPLATLLSLSAPKLASLAHGWTPPEIELSTWRELRWVRTSGSGYDVNAYLAWDEVTRDAAIFDTGWDATPLLALLDENQIQLRHLFITHTHEDHIAALGEIRGRWPKVKLHSNSPAAPPEQRNRANDCISLGSLRITHRSTPGHAADGVTYLIGNWPEDAPHVAVAGDAVFAGSIGKATGDAFQTARKAIREQIFSLPPDTLIGPGHGPLTTVALERAHNPFFD